MMLWDQPRLRVVSLLASSTETVAALGRQSWLVGRSHECDYPVALRRLPACTRPPIGVDKPSAEIDRSIRRLLERGLSIYLVDTDRLRELDPDVILTQDRCEVCAVSLCDVERATCEWLGKRPRIVSSRPDSLGGVWRDLQGIADVIGEEERGRRLVRQLQDRMLAVAHRAGEALTRPSVGCIEWIDPLMSSGYWMPELVEMAGGRNAFGEAGRRSPWLSWETLRESDPDVLVVAPCGFDVAHTRHELSILERHDDWTELRAVRHGRVYIVDGNAYLHRPGPRLADSLEILAQALHPELFEFRYPGAAYRPYAA